MEAQEKEHIKNKLYEWSGILARKEQAICGPWPAPSRKWRSVRIRRATPSIFEKTSENNTQTKRAMLGLRQCHNATSQLANGGGRYERVMSRFRRMRSLQKFASIHSSVYNHFNHQRNIESRAKFKSLRDAALREWRDLLVA